MALVDFLCSLGTVLLTGSFAYTILGYYIAYNPKVVAYAECQMRCAELQAKYTADLDHKNQRIADLELYIEDIALSRDWETILRDTIGLTQSGSTYGGSIGTSSGHARQGNNFANITAQNSVSFVVYGNMEVQIYTPAGYL